MTIVLSGSLAFDYIMNFPGHFEDHILPDKIHVLNVSFLVDSLDRQRGGVAGNIAYSLGLLKQRCRLIGTVGHDFADYRSDLESLGVDLSGVIVIEELMTASAFITTDRADNQITGFFPGAMANAGDYSVEPHLDGCALAVVSPTAPAAMVRHIEELKANSVPYMFDPGQQVIALSGSQLSAGIQGATILAANDYELALIQEKSGMSREQIVEAVPIVAVTFGDLGSTIYADGTSWTIPPVEPTLVVDPTGAGDGYRAGLVAAFTAGLGWDVGGRIASTAATYVVERKGTQAHSYTVDEFRDRFTTEFRAFAGALDKIFTQ